MHKTILFLLAFLITPITASYAVDSSIPCKERKDCSVTAAETEGNETKFAGCVWIDIPNGAILTNGVTSGDGKCQKKWYCKNDGYYTKVHTKTPTNGTAITNRFSHVSCEPCPNACREDDPSCIKKAEQENNVRTSMDSTENYNTAQSVNDCYLKILAPAAEDEITGSDEIGSFRTKKSDNPFICRY